MPYLKHFSLTAIAEALGLDTEGAHTAAVDANLARLVYHKLHRANRLDRWVLQGQYLKNT